MLLGKSGQALRGQGRPRVPAPRSLRFPRLRADYCWDVRRLVGLPASVGVPVPFPRARPPAGAVPSLLLEGDKAREVLLRASLARPLKLPQAPLSLRQSLRKLLSARQRSGGSSMFGGPPSCACPLLLAAMSRHEEGGGFLCPPVGFPGSRPCLPPALPPPLLLPPPLATGCCPPCPPLVGSCSLPARVWPWHSSPPHPPRGHGI